VGLLKKTKKAGDEPSDTAAQGQTGDQKISERLEYGRSHRTGYKRLLWHPFKVITEHPVNILIVAVPAALLFFLSGAVINIQNQGLWPFFASTTLDDLIIFSLLIALTPLAILDFRESQRVKHLEAALPNFFRDLAGMNDSGMTLPNAVHLAASGEYSTLTPYVKKMDSDMSWNVPFVEAITDFGKRLATPLALRSVDLIAKASKAGGDASEVLRAAAVDTYEFVKLRTERTNSMMTYVIIVLVSFMVFLFVIFILVDTFLTTMASAATSSAAVASSAQFIKSLDIAFYARIFSHAAMIQGVFSGLVAGQMGEGRVIAGLKYSVIMLFIAWVTFRFFI
jgi:flagellar protein FlaJ